MRYNLEIETPKHWDHLYRGDKGLEGRHHTDVLCILKPYVLVGTRIQKLAVSHTKMLKNLNEI
jgi:hypothetical protein